MNDQVRVDINSPLISSTEKPKQYCARTHTFKLLLCTFTILSTIAYLVYSQFNDSHSVSPTISTMSVVASNDDDMTLTVPAMAANDDDVGNNDMSLVVPTNDDDDNAEAEDPDIGITNYCGLQVCKVGYSNWPGQPSASYTSCYYLMDWVANILSGTAWASATARVKELTGYKITTCLKNKLAKKGEYTAGVKTIDCSSNPYNCGSVSATDCYGKCSSSLVWISGPNFWSQLPVMTGGSYSAYYAAPCVAEALTNYLSNFYCMRSDNAAQAIGEAFGQWMREYAPKYGYYLAGATQSECPRNCDLGSG